MIFAAETERFGLLILSNYSEKTGSNGNLVRPLPNRKICVIGNNADLTLRTAGDQPAGIRLVSQLP